MPQCESPPICALSPCVCYCSYKVPWTIVATKGDLLTCTELAAALLIIEEDLQVLNSVCWTLFTFCAALLTSIFSYGACFVAPARSSPLVFRLVLLGLDRPGLRRDPHVLHLTQRPVQLLPVLFYGPRRRGLCCGGAGASVCLDGRRGRKVVATARAVGGRGGGAHHWTCL